MAQRTADAVSPAARSNRADAALFSICRDAANPAKDNADPKISVIAIDFVFVLFTIDIAKAVVDAESVASLERNTGADSTTADACAVFSPVRNSHFCIDAPEECVEAAIGSTDDKTTSEKPCGDAACRKEQRAVR